MRRAHGRSCTSAEPSRAERSHGVFRLGERPARPADRPHRRSLPNASGHLSKRSPQRAYHDVRRLPGPPPFGVTEHIGKPILRFGDCHGGHRPLWPIWPVWTSAHHVGLFVTRCPSADGHLPPALARADDRRSSADWIATLGSPRSWRVARSGSRPERWDLLRVPQGWGCRHSCPRPHPTQAA